MTELLDRITQDSNNALKGKDEAAVSTLRFLRSNLHNAKIAKGEELTDDEITAEIAKDAKRHRESIEAFEKGGRDDLVGKEKAELEILLKYLPKQLTEEQIGKLVDEAISQVGANSLSDMGAVMAKVMRKIHGQADGAVVSAIVKEKLSNH